MHYHLDQLDFGLWVIVAENTGSESSVVMEVIILHSNNSRGRMGFRQDTIKGLVSLPCDPLGSGPFVLIHMTRQLQ